MFARGLARLFPPGTPRRQQLENVADLVLDRGGRRRFVARDYLFRLSSRFTPAFEIEAEGAHYILSTRDKEVSRILFVHGYYDKLLFQDVRRVLSALDGRPFSLEGRTFLDIGANIGSSTVEALRNQGARDGIAFEPEPENFRFLLHNLVANDLLDRVQRHRLALSDREGELAFELSDEIWGDHRVVNGTAPATDFGTTIRVPATTLDAMVESGDVNLDEIGLAWMDVQGHEPEVLAGATALTDSDVPVVVEYWPHGLERAGGVDRFDRVVSRSYTHFVDTKGDLSDPVAALRPVAELPGLRERYPGFWQPTDLVLLKR